jgi:hypothetical protein
MKVLVKFLIDANTLLYISMKFENEVMTCQLIVSQAGMSLDFDGPCPLGRSFFAEFSETGGKDSMSRDSLLCGSCFFERVRQADMKVMDDN